MDRQDSTGPAEWRQLETTVSYGPMVYQVRLKPNYGEREERDERKVPRALHRTKDNHSMGTPPCPKGQKSAVMHRLIYH